MTKNNNKKAFTLVELLIVIVVVGILAAMMMLSSTEAVSSAKAAKIISDMHNIKTAVLSWYLDNLDKVVKVGNEYKIRLTPTSTPKYLGEYLAEGSGQGRKEILKYLDGGMSIELNPHNSIESTANSLGTGSYFLCSETFNEVSQVQNDEGAYETDKSSGVKLTGNSWFVGYYFGKNEGALKEKVAAKAKSLGLIGGNKKVVNDTYSSEKGNYVYMLIDNLD